MGGAEIALRKNSLLYFFDAAIPTSREWRILPDLIL